MPKINFPTIGDIEDYEFLQGTIKSIDSSTDTCTVEVDGSVISAVLFYHCLPDSQLRENGAIEGSAAGFAENDSVIVQLEYDKTVARVVAHVDGVRTCGNGLLFYYSGYVWSFGSVDSEAKTGLVRQEFAVAGNPNYFLDIAANGDYVYVLFYVEWQQTVRISAYDIKTGSLLAESDIIVDTSMRSDQWFLGANESGVYLLHNNVQNLPAYERDAENHEAHEVTDGSVSPGSCEVTIQRFTLSKDKSSLEKTAFYQMTNGTYLDCYVASSLCVGRDFLIFHLSKSAEEYEMSFEEFCAQEWTGFYMYWPTIKTAANTAGFKVLTKDLEESDLDLSGLWVPLFYCNASAYRNGQNEVWEVWQKSGKYWLTKLDVETGAYFSVQLTDFILADYTRTSISSDNKGVLLTRFNSSQTWNKLQRYSFEDCSLLGELIPELYTTGGALPTGFLQGAKVVSNSVSGNTYTSAWE